MATCPECDAEIEVGQDDLDEMEVREPWNCDACGSSLRVASIAPLDFEGDDEDEDEDEDEEESDKKETEEDDDLDDDDDDDDEKDDNWDE